MALLLARKRDVDITCLEIAVSIALGALLPTPGNKKSLNLTLLDLISFDSAAPPPLGLRGTTLRQNE